MLLSSSLFPLLAVLGCAINLTVASPVSTAGQCKTNGECVRAGQPLLKPRSPSKASRALPSGTPPPADLVDATNLVNLHTVFRAHYGAGPVTWDDTLAAYAYDWAKNCVYEHTHGPHGENLAAGGTPGYSQTDLFNLWAAESAQYDYNNPGFSLTTGHFTQVVWKATTKIGCAAVTCPVGAIFPSYAALYLVCEYETPGNYEGEFPANVGTYQP